MAATDNDIDDTTLLFAESNSRFVLEVKPEHEARVFELFAGVPLFELGEVTQEPQLHIEALLGTVPVNVDVATLHETWRTPLYAAMGEDPPPAS